MLHWLETLSPLQQALLATGFTWGITALGATTVFVTREVSPRLLDALLGLAGGVMLAASYWSLLAPALEMTQGQWLPVAIGFLLGGAFVWSADKILPHLHLKEPTEGAEGPKTRWHRSILLVLAITLHNIPEGLAVGVAFGAVAYGIPEATLGGAIALAIGIGLQNFPEGLAVAMPLRREGLSPFKSFWFGQLSATVEIPAGVLGAAFVLIAQPLLPYALSFAAGAMIFVVVEEVVPEMQQSGNTDLATLALMLGFVVMMALDVALG
ncbi:ZIP family metal transporter [Meiothermus hypogaeus]|uniref:Zinc transporter n=2 Tax=Meiothermus hypogaeus TaxID=884155 RepID=A0A511QXD1_9DEIN|nr:ZIP family metal transporter [Meiothermus hypogaeus]RIH77497.1 Zinc transporter ZupT [Meiothermus hypogaeus]GEM82033.1 zinc transporter [Meiothermus hypogaeus NBRC 106114]GIW35971.1 MAG: zinc transporter [Meiothermus sp.]